MEAPLDRDLVARPSRPRKRCHGPYDEHEQKRCCARHSEHHTADDANGIDTAEGVIGGVHASIVSHDEVFGGP